MTIRQDAKLRSDVGSGKKDDRRMVLREVLDCLPDMCFILRADGCVIEANARARQVLGFQRGEIIGRAFSSLLSEEHQRSFADTVKECGIAREFRSCELKLLASADRKIEASICLGRFPAENDCLTECIVIARDISHEKERELELLRFSKVAHFTANPVEITDANGNIIYVNPAFEDASGFSKEEVVGRNPRIFGSGKHSKSFWRLVWDTITQGKVWVGEVENRKRDGSPYHTYLLISPIIDEEGKMVGYFGVHRDITEQKYLQQQLIQAQKMESIGTLAAGIAHEVGNPLTSISSLVQVIQRTTADEPTKDKLELIRTQVSRISRIIRDLVDFSRPSRYEVVLTDINKRVREAVEIVRVGKKARDIVFNLELDESIPMLPLVPDQIEQVFINILINSVDALQGGSGLVSKETGETSQPRIHILTGQDDGHLLISIRDNGKGIFEHDKSKVFEPFFTTKNVGDGTGLGLWVSYGIAKSFGGDIRVDSEVGKGSSFTVVLPLY